ncbi:MAG: TonB-dependent receptor [Flavobacteriales bacterium]|jgi:outer membrane receptor protein involved in Fe transport
MKKALLIAGALFTSATAFAQEAAADSLFNMLDEITVTSNVIDIAKERETPIAVSTISPAEISLKVGNLEFVEVMNNTPGVYATKQGGGYGDSRLSLRGFDQRNTSFLINGQPVNDMENGWVYWSNWQGLSDVASGIQIQRGLGASRLAVPSVGGTVSIFTKAAELKQGGSFAQSAGNDGYFKTTASYNSGKDANGWASSVLISRWMGNGYINQTQGEGYNYFAAVGYNPEGSDHSMNLSIIGAGQWHHQRDVWVSIRDYQHFTADNGFKGDGGDINRRWNTNGGTLNGEEFSMRRNFYNKPLATFNWDWDIAENVKLATSLYGSAGRGGGTGPRGNYFRNSDMNVLPYRKDLYEHWVEDMDGDASRNEDGTINFDNIIALNQSTTDGYTGEISDFNGQLIGSNGFRDSNVNRAVMVRRASMNSHNWIGAISNLEITQGKMTYSIGVDLRNYTGYHYRAMNNLMGLDGYYSTGNDNENGRIINTTIEASPFNNTGIAGPKLDYYNIGKVGWQGLNGMAEYNDNGRLTAVVQAGVSNQSFQRIDYFDQANNPVSEVSSLLGGYAKGGANYNIDDQSNVFANAGYISRQPNFDGVFPGYANDINPDLQNEEIISFELGYGYRTSNLVLNVNAYATNWGNRFISRSLLNANGTEGTAQFRDIDVQHNGIELEATYFASNNLTVKTMLSLGDWRYTKDFESVLFDDNQNEIGTGVLYVAGARVGDAAQTTAVINADYKVSKKTSLDMNFRYVDGLYADWSVVDSDFKNENNNGALKLPSYNLIDMGVTTRFDLFGNNASFRFNVNNLLNTVYIAESNTNIHAAEGDPTWNGVHTANSVWFGFGRTWNATLRYNF